MMMIMINADGHDDNDRMVIIGMNTTIIAMIDKIQTLR